MENEQPRRKINKLVCRGDERSCVHAARPCTPHHDPWWIPRADRGEYHGLTVVASGRYGSVASWTLRFELCLGSLDSPGIACSGPIGLVLLLSWLSWPQLLAFILELSPKYANLQSKFDKAKTKRNQRNICINRKLMQINPKFWAQII